MRFLFYSRMSITLPDEEFILISNEELSICNDENCNPVSFFEKIKESFWNLVSMIGLPNLLTIKDYGSELKKDVITNNCEMNIEKKSASHCIIMRSIEEINRSYFRVEISDIFKNRKWQYLSLVVKNIYENDYSNVIQNLAISMACNKCSQLIKYDPRFNFLLNLLYNGYLLYNKSKVQFAISMVNIVASYMLENECDITLSLIQFFMDKVNV